MTKEQAIAKAKEIYNDIGSDPQAACAIISIARFLMEAVCEKKSTPQQGTLTSIFEAKSPPSAISWEKETLTQLKSYLSSNTSTRNDSTFSPIISSVMRRLK